MSHSLGNGLKSNSEALILESLLASGRVSCKGRNILFGKYGQFGFARVTAV